MGTSMSIAASRLTKRFGDVTAVNDLSLNIGSGEIYGFLGLNGAGKTTTIRMLLGMIRPSAGSVSLFGMKVQPGQHSIWRRVGYLVETPHAYPDLTVRENLEIVRRWRKLNDAGAVERTMDELGLTHYANRRARTLSLGNAQRLGLAKALMHHPDLLLLDEPANALDPAGIVEVRILLRDLAERSGVTIFISSHILSEVARLATRIGVVHQGRLVKELNTRELAEQEDQRLVVDVRDTGTAQSVLEKASIAARSDGKNSLVITDKEAMQHPDEVATLLVQGGCPPTRLAVEQTDLESYFLGLVGMKEERKQ
ncbi:MAG: ABC transporter ATP-binding protein [Chloroflexi bacterium]|nr:ABC transporter ATP-binding protein [Chloroflexota bacterium]